MIEARERANEFAKLNLRECAAELLAWKETSILVAGGKMRQLAQLCAEYTGDTASLGVAEATVNAAALAAQALPASADFQQLWNRHGVDGDAYDVAEQWFSLGRQASHAARHTDAMEGKAFELLQLLREVRPTIPREVLELWCKDRDNFIAGLSAGNSGGGATVMRPFQEAETPVVRSYRSEPGQPNEDLMAVAQYHRVVRGFQADNVELHLGLNALEQKKDLYREQREEAQRQLSELLSLLGVSDVEEAGEKLGGQSRSLADLERVKQAWPDLYSAFKGAFDTPVARRRQSDEYATDARDRMREMDALFSGSGTQDHAHKPQLAPVQRYG